MPDAVVGVTEAEATAQRLLSEHGAYSPIELLLATNSLTYEDYRAWRTGERHTLDDVLAAGVEETRRLVEEVRSWARSLHLHPDHVPFFGVEENAGNRTDRLGRRGSGHSPAYRVPGTGGPPTDGHFPGRQRDDGGERLGVHALQPRRRRRQGTARTPRASGLRSLDACRRDDSRRGASRATASTTRRGTAHDGRRSSSGGCRRLAPCCAAARATS